MPTTNTTTDSKREAMIDRTETSQRKRGKRDIDRIYRTTPTVNPNGPTVKGRHLLDYKLPPGAGYRLSRGGALIGPGGQVLTDPVHKITVHEPGRAWTKHGARTNIVRWQPDARELDAYERRHEQAETSQRTGDGLTRPIIDPHDPAADSDDPEHFDVPAGVGYRIAGSGITRVLLGPNGQPLTHHFHTITVTEPGEAQTRLGSTTETVHWQPDLRELDAYERRNEAATETVSSEQEPTPRPVAGYGPDGEPLSDS
jgi:hypothetical protein